VNSVTGSPGGAGRALSGGWLCARADQGQTRLTLGAALTLRWHDGLLVVAIAVDGVHLDLGTAVVGHDLARGGVGALLSVRHHGRGQRRRGCRPSRSRGSEDMVIRDGPVLSVVLSFVDGMPHTRSPG
jgi:hypothetical protein